MMKVHTVRQAVDALGGTFKAARFLKIVPSAVSNMLAANEIPRAYHWQLEQALAALGYEVDHAALFGLGRDELVAHLRETLGRPDHDPLPAVAQ